MVEGYERESEVGETHSCVLKLVLSLSKGEKIDNFDCQGLCALLAFSPFDTKTLQTFDNTINFAGYSPNPHDEEDRDLLFSTLSNFLRRPSLSPSKRYASWSCRSTARIRHSPNVHPHESWTLYIEGIWTHAAGARNEEVTNFTLAADSSVGDC